MHVTDALQRLDVGIMRVGIEGIDEKDYGRNVALRDACRDLCVTTIRPRQVGLYRQPGSRVDPLAGGAGGDQLPVDEGLAMLDTEIGKGS